MVRALDREPGLRVVDRKTKKFAREWPVAKAGDEIPVWSPNGTMTGAESVPREKSSGPIGTIFDNQPSTGRSGTNSPNGTSWRFA